MKKRKLRELDFDAEYEELFGDRRKGSSREVLEDEGEELESILHKKGPLRIILICTIVLIVVGTIFMMNRNSENEAPSTVATYPEQTDAEEEPTIAGDLEYETEAEPDATEENDEDEDNVPLTRDNSSAELTMLFSGTFFVGDDIPPGRYVISGDEPGNLFVRRGGRAIVNEILGDGDWGVPTITISLQDGDEIEISGISNVTFTPAETELLTTLTTGDWVVGIDILAGTYDASAVDEDDSGNFFVRRSGRAIVNEILGGTFGVDRVRVILEDGDVITISSLNAVEFE